MADAVVYVDGLNLYHGLKSKYGRAYLWLDLVELMRRVRRHDNVIKVRYFTSIVKGEPEAARRQETYLSVLTTLHPELDVVRGYFKKKTARCHVCTTKWTCSCVPPRNFQTYEEKLTDVALGVSMVTDAATGYGEASILISADADFRPALQASLEINPARPVIIASPPGRIGPKHSLQGRITVFAIPEEHLAASLLADTVYGPDGRVYERPKKWR